MQNRLQAYFSALCNLMTWQTGAMATEMNQRLRWLRELRGLTVEEVEIVRGGVNLVPRSTNPRHQPIFIPRGHFDDGVEVTIKGRVVTVQQDLS